MRGSFLFQFGLFLIMFFATSAAFAQDKDIKLLGKWMTGSWDTFAQVDADEAADLKYRHIRALLHVAPVVIPELKNGLAFYVENQQAESRTKPYRQRIYFLSRLDGEITLQIYKISKAEDFVNAYKRADLLKNLTFSGLTKEDGCDLIYKKIGKTLFKGKTNGGKACRSNLRGATYTYSESEISPVKWINLDQGFDDAGNHKWGPPPGTIGHIFVKRKN